MSSSNCSPGYVPARLPAGSDVHTVRTVHNGYLVGVDVSRLARAFDGLHEEVEVVFRTRVGHHLVFGDMLCEIRGGQDHDRARVAEAALAAITLENLPNIDLDPGYAVDQLVNVAWTTGSSSQQNPEAAMATVTTIRDLISRWTTAGLPPAEDYGGPLPIAYEDGIVAQALGRLASLLAGASAAGQHQTVAHVIEAFALMLPHLVVDDQTHALDALARALPAAAGQVRTHELDGAITALRNAVYGLGRPDIEESIDSFAASLLTSDYHWVITGPVTGSSSN